MSEITLVRHDDGIKQLWLQVTTLLGINIAVFVFHCVITLVIGLYAMEHNLYLLERPHNLYVKGRNKYELGFV